MNYATWGGLYCLILFVVNHSAWVDYPPFWVYPHLWWPYLLQFSPAPRCRCIVASFSLQSIIPIFLFVFPFFNMGLYGNISSYVPSSPHFGQFMSVSMVISPVLFKITFLYLHVSAYISIFLELHDILMYRYCICCSLLAFPVIFRVYPHQPSRKKHPMSLANPDEFRPAGTKILECGPRKACWNDSWGAARFDGATRGANRNHLANLERS